MITDGLRRTNYADHDLASTRAGQIKLRAPPTDAA
jgi:hypothetical protein